MKISLMELWFTADDRNDRIQSRQYRKLRKEGKCFAGKASRRIPPKYQNLDI
jgi:hypothetical protein